MIYTSKDTLLKWLKQHLSDERFLHTLGVAETAEQLAEQFMLNKEKAYIAGLLHDCAKCYTNEQLFDIINKHLPIDECEMINPKTYHAPVGAYIAKHELGINDLEILSAIRWHTIGKIDMSDFEKIIFIADKIEPKTRPTEYINKIRPKLLENNGLNKALLECYNGTIKSLVDRNLKICISTIEIYNHLLEECKK
jgi:predicted HD superfamily hydrolase involved in NAD metabolism